MRPGEVKSQKLKTELEDVKLFKPDGSEHAFVALDGEPCVAATLVEGTIELR